MPQVRFRYSLPDGTPATGTVFATPTRRHHRDDKVILPAPLTIEIDSRGEATANLAPTAEGWVWQIREHMNLPHPETIYVIVPDQTGTIDLTDLEQVDPRSLQPAATPGARWWAELRANNSTAQEVRAIRDLVLPARDETLAARDETLAHGITVDTSVGTRVFVGDTMIYGDTGWRDISSLVTFPVTNGWMRMRRVGLSVEVLANSLSVETSGSVSIMTLPSGFRPAALIPLETRAYWGSDTVEIGRVNSTGVMQFRTLSSGNQMNIHLTFTTQNPWPTSLPGSPA